MSKKVTFINPPLTPKERYGRLRSGGDFIPPYGLTHLAASVREVGWDPAIVDAPALGWDTITTAKASLDDGAHIVGITAATMSIYNAHDLALAVKSLNPDAKIIIGGPHLTALPEDTLQRFPGFDIGVVGEGDSTIVELAEALHNGIALEPILGIVYRHNGEVLQTARQQLVPNLDSLPKPAWDLLPNLAKCYRPSIMGYVRLPANSIVLSRGCPFHCTFCSAAVFGNTIRAYSAQVAFHMMAEMRQRYGIRELEIRDENFLVGKHRMIELCQRLQAANIDLTWSCNARVDAIEPEILQAMQKARCWQIAFGIESGDQRILDMEKKGVSLEEIRRAVRLTAEAGIQARGFFMLGHPGETEESLKKTVDFACQLPLSSVHFTHFTPLPGSPIYRQADHFGQFDNDWRKLTYWHPVFIPNGLHRKTLARWERIAFRRFYLRPKILWYHIRKTTTWTYFSRLAQGAFTLLQVLTRWTR
jgi:anaerobic magnesium-protoporphyrin IX monomethyl ester cyclase